jgi:hypothetical protein
MGNIQTITRPEESSDIHADITHSTLAQFYAALLNLCNNRL